MNKGFMPQILVANKIHGNGAYAVEKIKQIKFILHYLIINKNSKK